MPTPTPPFKPSQPVPFPHGSNDTLPAVLRVFRDRFEDARTTPIVLETTLGALGLGQAARTGAEEALTNRSGRPILIDEIRIQCGLYDGSGGTALADITASQFGWVLDSQFLATDSPLRGLQAQIQLGSIMLTREFVPVWGLASGWEVRADTVIAVWRPRVPFYLEDGEMLQVRLRYAGYGTGNSVNGGAVVPNQTVSPHVSLVGRVLEDPQHWLADGEARILPFASTYSPATFVQANSTNVTVQNSDSAFINGFETGLYVHKFVGRCYNQFFDTNLGVLDPTILAANAAVLPGPLANISELGIKIRMETSRGLSMVKDYVPFGHLFSPVDSSWWVNTILMPRESFRAFLLVDFTNGTAFMNDGTNVNASITMHGSVISNRFGSSTQAVRVARMSEYYGNAANIMGTPGMPMSTRDPAGTMLGAPIDVEGE